MNKQITIQRLHVVTFHCGLFFFFIRPESRLLIIKLLNKNYKMGTNYASYTVVKLLINN